MDTLKCKARLKIFRSGTSFGPGTAELMEHIQTTQSLKESCRMMGMAYSKGWKILKRAEEDLGLQVIVSSRGGKSGGTTMLTEDGKRFLAAYRNMEREMNQTLAEGMEKYFKDYLETKE